MNFGMMNNSISELFKTKGVDEPSTKKITPGDHPQLEIKSRKIYQRVTSRQGASFKRETLK